MINDGGPVFARPRSVDPDRYGGMPTVHEAQEGLSLRDYLAGQALVGLVVDHIPERAATVAYLYADAILAERHKQRRT